MHTASRVTQISVLALGIAGALAFGQAQASGFQLRENSVKNLGRANTGTAVAEDDASVVANNPAAMVNLTQSTFQIDATDIDLDAEFTGGGFADAGTPLQNPLSGGNGGDPGSPKVVPAVAFVMPVGDAFRLGASVSAPFGLKTEYDNGWQGRYFAQESSVKVVDLTLSQAVDFGTALFSNPATRPLPFASPQAADGFAKVQADDTGFGFVVGANFTPTDKLAIGLSYRSEIDYELSGSVDWTVPDNVAAVFAAGPSTRALFQDGGMTADLTTPSITSLDMRYDFTDRVAMMATWTKTGWSSMREVRIDFDNPDPDSVEPFDWHDTRFMSLGAEFKLNDSFTLRAGVAHDETPTPIETRSPRLPDADRTWYSVGATWRAARALEVNFGYTRIQPDAPHVDITARGSHLVGPFDGHADLYGVSAQYKF